MKIKKWNHQFYATAFADEKTMKDKDKNIDGKRERDVLRIRKGIYTSIKTNPTEKKERSALAVKYEN